MVEPGGVPEVAIKVLSLSFSDNAERKARFDREAQTIAGLNHPHICILHDVGHQEDADYLVMEYLEGQTLAARLEKGPVPFDEAPLRCFGVLAAGTGAAEGGRDPFRAAEGGCDPLAVASRSLGRSRARY